MAYTFDRKKYEDLFDKMHGEGARERALSTAAETGTRIGTLRREAEQRAQAQRLLEAAAKEAAKKERERKEKEAKEKASGRKETELSRQIEDKKFRIKESGGSTEKKQSKIGKALNLDPDNNLFFDALDILSRPLNALNAGEMHNAQLVGKLKKDLKAGKITEKQYYDTLNEKGRSMFSKDYWKDALKGLKGEEKVFGSDLLEAKGMKKGAGRAVTGFAMDVAMDPLNLLGAPIGKAVTGGAKLVGKGASKIPGVSRAADGIENIFVGNKRMRTTLNGGQSDDLLDLTRSAENMRNYSQIRSQEDVARATLNRNGRTGAQIGREMEAPLRQAQPVNPAVAPNALSNQALMDALGTPSPSRIRPLTDPIGRVGRTTFKTTDNGINVGPTERWGTRDFNVASDIERFVTSTRNLPIKEAAEQLKSAPAVSRAAQILMDSNAELRKFAADNGYTINNLNGYLAHVLTREARKIVEESGGAVSDGVARVGGNKKVNQRELHDTVDNINRKKGMEWFNPDALVSTAEGQRRTINAMTKEIVKDRILSNPDFARELTEGMRPGKNAVEMTIDGKRYAVTKGAETALVNFQRIANDESVDKFFKGFDKLQNMWKKTALFSAGFHIRNAVGNSWNMYASGLRMDEVVKYQAEAAYALEGIKARRVGRSTKAAKNIDKAYDEFLQQGLRNTGSAADFATDPSRAVMSEVGARTKGRAGRAVHDVAEAFKTPGAWEKTKAIADSPFAASRRLGDEADEISRFALFKWARDKGMSPKEAGEKVREVLFDYTRLTEVEQKYFKRLAPFYTWMRKNAEFQIKAFAKNPERFNRLNVATENAYDNVDMNQEITPEWMREGLALPIPGTDRLLSVNPPAADLSKMTDPGKMLIDSLTPVLKAPLEIGMNRSTFNDRQIKEFDGQTGDIAGVEVPVQLEYLIENLIAPVRNLSGAMERQTAGDSPIDVMQKMVGGDLAKPWNEESFQNEADWKENERLQGIIDRMEKQEGTDVQTKSELEKQGIYAPDDYRADASASLQEMGFNPRQVDMLIALKKKVYDGNEETAAKVRAVLEAQGVPEEAIELVTSEYLSY
jgi:hypothetical protein